MPEMSDNVLSGPLSLYTLLLLSQLFLNATIEELLLNSVGSHFPKL